MSREQGTSLPAVQLYFLQLLFEAQVETVQWLMERVDQFQRQLRVLTEQGQPTYEMQRAFEIWVGQLRNRPRGYYGPVWETTTSTARNE